MHEWWTFFKNLPCLVKIRYVTAILPGFLLYMIVLIGEVAEHLARYLGKWVYRGTSKRQY